MFNKVVLVGNLTRDIELRYFQSGSAVGKAGIAVTRKYNAANGEKREETCFIDIDFFGRTAEIANQYLHKGSKVLIEGRLVFQQWQDQQSGQNRSKHSIAVEQMEMLGDPQQQNSGGNNYGYGNNSYGGNSQNVGYGSGNYGGYNNSYGGNSYGGGNYSGAARQQTAVYQQRQQVPQSQQQLKAPPQPQSAEPEIDVDADKYENDDRTIPF